MNKVVWTMAAVLGVALGGLAAPAGAAPAARSGALAVKDAALETTPVNQVRYRRCWRDEDGYLHCRRRFYPYYLYDNYYDAPYYYGPGIGFFFGGGGHRHHHHHHGHHHRGHHHHGHHHRGHHHHGHHHHGHHHRGHRR